MKKDKKMKKKSERRSKGRSVCSLDTVNFLKRMAKRNGISYEHAVVKFYGRPISSLGKSLAIALGVHIE
jgi:hypothetical protein